MDCYVINLDRDVARLERMDKLLRRHEMRYARVPAVLGRELSGSDADFAAHARRRHLGRGEVGCMLSHIRVWRQICEKRADHAIVLEDDVHFAADFGDFLRRLNLDKKDHAIHKIETLFARATLRRAPHARVGHRTAHELLTNHGGSAAYILNRQSATYLLDHCDAFQHAIDAELFDLQLRSTNGLTIYQWTPAPCIQDSMLEAKGELQAKTNIGSERSDIHTGRFRASVGLRNSLKRCFRPIYTAAFSGLVSWKGLKRVELKFG